MWTQGEINGYKYCAKHFEEGSEYGIGGNGRISKLNIRKDGRELYNFERGLDFDKLDHEGRKVYEEILKMYN